MVYGNPGFVVCGSDRSELVICEKGRDWFREMMGVKMGSRYVELPMLVIDDEW